jgi:pyruvate-formate lyase-activating enzyme
MSYAVYKFQPEIGEFSACCDATAYKFDLELFQSLGSDYFEKHPKLIKRKAALYNNQRHGDCTQCWKKEDTGLTSMRQQQGPEYTMLAGNEDLSFQSAYPGRIEMWMNSTCNLGCFMCHLGNSNTLRKIWHSDRDSFGNDGKGFTQYVNNSEYMQNDQHQLFVDAILEFTTKHIREARINDLTIAYLGGEPTLHSEMYDHADHFIEAGRQSIKDGKKLVIEFTTNGTSKDKLNERFYRMFAKYKAAGWQVCMKLSQDAAGSYAQVRHGADFEQIKRNFGNWMSADSDVDQVDSFSVISALNLPYIDVMAEYIEEVVHAKYSPNKHLSIHFNTLIDPAWMQVKHVPKRFVTHPAATADKIFTGLSNKYNNLTYNQSLFKNIVSNTVDTVSAVDAKYFFDNLDYVNTVYQKTYPAWDFFSTFPHLNEYATEYGIK